jgi:aryl-alcohol dehydrogenase-like predicted oxidoreductase
MHRRAFGRYGDVSALTLGGGGIGAVWGSVERAEAVATVRAALDGGITHIDVAPTYGPGEAELVVGEALGGRRPDGLLITTKVGLPEAEPDALERTLEESVRASLERLRIDRIDLLLFHTQIAPSGMTPPPQLIGVDRFREVVRPAFERLRGAGTIGGWGLTGVGHPETMKQLLAEEPRPYGVQCVVNALDMSGDVWVFGDGVRPDNAGVIAAAVAADVPVIAIRAVAAGSLADALDRPVDPGHPAARDFEAAAPFRRLASERGETAAFLAHRYALSVPGPATVVLGVKNREELAECLAAEQAGPLDDATLRAIAGQVSALRMQSPAGRSSLG